MSQILNFFFVASRDVQEVSADLKRRLVQTFSKFPIIVGIDPQEAIPQQDIRMAVLKIIQSRSPLGRNMTSGTSLPT